MRTRADRPGPRWAGPAAWTVTAASWVCVAATALHLGHQTVRNYVSAVFLKLGVSDRAGAIVTAREAGLGARPR